MVRYVGHVVPYNECAICGKSLWPQLDESGHFKQDRIETIRTKRKTEVRFHKKCYEELCKKQRSGNANT